MSGHGAQIATTALGTAALAASFVPGFGTIAAGILGLGATLATVFGKKKQAKNRKPEEETSLSEQNYKAQTKTVGGEQAQGGPVQGQQQTENLLPEAPVTEVDSPVKATLDPIIQRYITGNQDKSFYA